MVYRHRIIDLLIQTTINFLSMNLLKGTYKILYPPSGYKKRLYIHNTNSYWRSNFRVINDWNALPPSLLLILHQLLMNATGYSHCRDYQKYMYISILYKLILMYPIIVLCISSFRCTGICFISGWRHDWGHNVMTTRCVTLCCNYVAKRR